MHCFCENLKWFRERRWCGALDACQVVGMTKNNEIRQLPDLRGIGEEKVYNHSLSGRQKRRVKRVANEDHLPGQERQ